MTLTGVLFLLVGIILPTTATDLPAVTIPSLGTVTGAISRDGPGIGVYKAIPYAKAPVGDLRFQPPVSHGPFLNGKINGTRFGATCMQWTTQVAKQSEDCLFLNVAAPLAAKPGDNLSTLVWIHGGAYVDGSSNMYHGDSLVARSKNTVVVVTLNYRLNIFGFLGGTEVARRSSDHGMGNFGIQDQREAMAWVQQHIGAFGGNPDDVTIFGESAGGNSVYNHLAQKASFQYYHKAIIESGVYDEGAQTAANAEQLYETILSKASCITLDCLVKMSASDLLALTKVALPMGSRNAKVTPWGPVVDGISLSATPEQLIAAKKYNDRVPIMIGSNRDEMAFWSLSSLQHNASEQTFDLWMESHGIVGKTLDEIKVVYGTSSYMYPQNLGNLSVWWWKLTRAVTDSVPGLGACGVRNVARLLTANGESNRFAYLFAHPTQSPFIPLPGDGPGSVTVGHATEIPYVYGYPSPILNSGEEEELAQSMSLYWLNFCKTGDPNGEYLPAKFPHYDSSTDRVMRFNTHSEGGIRAQSNLRKTACDWQDKHRVPLK